MSSAERRLAALFDTVGSGFLAQPPGLEGPAGLGIAGVTGGPRVQGWWDVLITAHAPHAVGDALHFVVLPQGEIIVDEDTPDGSLTPLVEAVERELSPPYRAQAVHHEGGVWAVAAAPVAVVSDDLDGDVLSVSSFEGRIDAVLDGEPCASCPEAFLDLGEPFPDGWALTAVRVEDDLWAVDLTPL